MKMKEDEISELPEPLLHHILSYLTTKDAMKTSILSKTWNSTSKSFPNLMFSQYSYQQYANPKIGDDVIQEFINFVDNSINNRNADASVQKFELDVDFKRFRLEDDKNSIEGWLSYAINHNVQCLVFTNSPGVRASISSIKNKGCYYILPQSIFRSKSLKTLDLFGCQIIEFGSIGLSLRKLSLIYVHIDQNILQTVLSKSCHLLEELTMGFCKGFTEIRVSGQSKLEKLELHLARNEVQTISIQAPNLRILSYSGGSNNVLSSIMGSKYEKIKELVLLNVNINDDELYTVLSRFCLLEKIKLKGCKSLTYVRVPRNITLSNFCVCDCVLLKKIYTKFN